MKKRVFKSKSLLLSLLLIVTVSFSLSAQDARKEYSENYDVSKGVTLTTDTKYSDVELITWDKSDSGYPGSGGGGGLFTEQGRGGAEESRYPDQQIREYHLPGNRDGEWLV